MTNYTSPAKIIADACVRLPRDKYGNPRYFVPTMYLPIGPGSREGNDIGLFKYRGLSLGQGFVIQSYDVESDLQRVLQTLHQMGYPAD